MTVREHMALQLAAGRFKFEGVRESRAVELLGMTPVRHAQVVLALLERPDVEVTYPREVHRLRRLRDARRAQRRRSGA